MEPAVKEKTPCLDFADAGGGGGGSGPSELTIGKGKPEQHGVIGAGETIDTCRTQKWELTEGLKALGLVLSTRHPQVNRNPNPKFDETAAAVMMPFSKHALDGTTNIWTRATEQFVKCESGWYLKKDHHHNIGGYSPTYLSINTTSDDGPPPVSADPPANAAEVNGQGSNGMDNSAAVLSENGNGAQQVSQPEEPVRSISNQRGSGRAQARRRSRSRVSTQTSTVTRSSENRQCFHTEIGCRPWVLDKNGKMHIIPHYLGYCGRYLRSKKIDVGDTPHKALAPILRALRWNRPDYENFPLSSRPRESRFI